MITKTGVHALLALTTLADFPTGARAGAAAIAGEIGAPANYLGKMLQAMTHEGLVTSQKGLGGGFQLARDPEEITLLDVMEPIEHVSRWNGCFLGRGTCSDEEPCQVHQRWSEVRNEYLRFLQETTIADLARKKTVDLKKDLAG